MATSQVEEDRNVCTEWYNEIRLGKKNRERVTSFLNDELEESSEYSQMFSTDWSVYINMKRKGWQIRENRILVTS